LGSCRLTLQVEGFELHTFAPFESPPPPPHLHFPQPRFFLGFYVTHTPGSIPFLWNLFVPPAPTTTMIFFFLPSRLRAWAPTGFDPLFKFYIPSPAPQALDPFIPFCPLPHFFLFQLLSLLTLSLQCRPCHFFRCFPQPRNPPLLALPSCFPRLRGTTPSKMLSLFLPLWPRNVFSLFSFFLFLLRVSFLTNSGRGPFFFPSLPCFSPCPGTFLPSRPPLFRGVTQPVLPVSFPRPPYDLRRFSFPHFTHIFSLTRLCNAFRFDLFSLR